MSDRKRALVVGCGGMGRNWIGTLLRNPRSEVAGLVDIREAACLEAAARAGIPDVPVFTGIRKAIRKTKPDFVVDVTIPESHSHTAVAALRMGVPVIGEKPMAETMASARRIIKASESTGLMHMVSQSRRYYVNHVATRGLIAGRRIGDVTTLNCDFYIGAHFGGFREQMDSPLILDMAIHHFDLCRYLSGADPVAVYAREFNPKGSWYKGDVSASCIFEMTDGIIFTYRGSWCGEGCHTSWNGDWRIIGTRGTLLMGKDKLPEGEVIADNNDPAFHSKLEPVSCAEPVINGSDIAGALNEMLDYLETGAMPQGECHDNIKSLAMVFAAIESSRKGRRIPVKW